MYIYVYQLQNDDDEIEELGIHLSHLPLMNNFPQVHIKMELKMVLPSFFIYVRSSYIHM